MACPRLITRETLRANSLTLRDSANLHPCTRRSLADQMWILEGVCWAARDTEICSREQCDLFVLESVVLGLEAQGLCVATASSCCGMEAAELWKGG